MGKFTDFGIKVFWAVRRTTQSVSSGSTTPLHRGHAVLTGEGTRDELSERLRGRLAVIFPYLKLVFHRKRLDQGGATELFRMMHKPRKAG